MITSENKISRLDKFKKENGEIIDLKNIIPKEVKALRF